MLLIKILMLVALSVSMAFTAVALGYIIVKIFTIHVLPHIVFVYNFLMMPVDGHKNKLCTDRMESQSVHGCNNDVDPEFNDLISRLAQLGI